MIVSTKELRESPGRIIKLATSGKEVTLTYRGKAVAKITSLADEDEVISHDKSTAFGMWAKHDGFDDVGSYVRTLRESRRHDY